MKTLEMFSLAGKIALVTGASRGIGAAIAKALAEAGADVAVVGRGEQLNAVADEIRSLGRRGLAMRTDLSQPGICAKVVQDTLDQYGSLDILVNCAGMIRRAPALEVSEQDWDAVMNLNLKVAFLISQAAAKHMVPRKSGKIINICSLLSFQGGIMTAAYTPSKSGLSGLTRLLANEWSQHGINVNGIAPGYIATELTEGLTNDPQRSAAILERIPQGRWGAPEDMKGAAVFLASRASDYIQGQMLIVDGGWMGR